MYLRLLFSLSILFLPLSGNAQSFYSTNSNNNKFIELLFNSPAKLISEQIKEGFTFYGLASYYNKLNYYIIDKNIFVHLNLNKEEQVILNQMQWLAVAGRNKVLLIKSPELSIRLINEELFINNPENLYLEGTTVTILNKNNLRSLSPELDQLRYTHLWAPLASLTKFVEYILLTIQININSSWGTTIIIFSILIKLLLLPLAIVTARIQQHVHQIQTILAPKIKEIKVNFDGEEAHSHLMASYKKLGVSPFFTLKPMLGSIIQIPILIAIFNALVEMPQFSGQSFLWIDNLAYPDIIGRLEFNVPMFGNTISGLPFLMTAVTLLSTLVFQKYYLSESEKKHQKRKLCLMASIFFILFYPFPSIVVLYWTLANVLQIFEQILIKHLA